MGKVGSSSELLNSNSNTNAKLVCLWFRACQRLGISRAKGLLVCASVWFPPASFVFCGLTVASRVSCHGFGSKIGFIGVKRARAGLGLFLGGVEQFHELILAKVVCLTVR